ncbi:PDZ domain-containing protein [Mycobacterium sp. CBMA271]|uniref:YlbL family protein n=1 Tax=unclassified Mycobacteroides TaxID=2618759 RepID=UPI0012DE0501|nr:MULTISPECIES: PDZ domain-containing protein [unclassified Mycobacteroides]MUM17927.1 signal protein PDZ [Mycobacteroides sp. CBMA 326]MUM20496.1 PDZ domain-containing protein [Mycobacteroides sp. CBMA 271]
MNRRVATLLVALIPIVAFGLLMAVITVPFVSLGPGPTFNTLGQVEGKEVVDIKGTPVDPVSGHLNMTTVSQRDGLTLADALRLWASGREQLVPRDVVYPPDRSKDQVDKDNDLEFKKSEESAEFAALGYLKYPTAVTVLTIAEDGPSKGKLHENDAITAVNGHPVATLDEFTGQLKLTKPGDVVTLDYKRKNAPNGTVKVTLGKNGDRDYGFLGVGVVQAPWAPFTIDFNLANIGGPSAGLMFSLAVIDKLTPEELDGGKFVAGTGTIDAEGKVGPIGGITHKMLAAKDAGATVFLVPAANCAEAKTDGGQGLTLVKVGTLTEAVDGLNALNHGGQAPSC